MRHSSSTASVPSRAVMKRQPNGLNPKTSSPSPMTYLPTGGCTTYAASVGIATWPWCWRTSSLAFFAQFASYPLWTSVQASLA